MARKMANTCFWPQKLLLVAAVAFIVGLSAEVQAEDKSIACDAESVTTGNTTSVNCHFSEDVNQTRMNFFVSFHKGDRKEKAVNVLACLWVSEETRCFVWPGYKYDGRISHEVSVEIPRASAKQVGTYECQLAHMDHNNITSCELRLEGKTQCYIESRAMTSQTSLTCYFPEDLSKTKADVAVYHYTRHGAAVRVISCKWKEEIVDCTAARGYDFDGSVTDHMTVGIPSVLKGHEGHYSCQFTGLGSHRYGNCYLGHEQEPAELITSSCNISSVKEMEPTSLTCTFSVNLNVTRKNFEVVRVDYEGKKVARIITCIWMDDTLVCATASGYLFNNTVTDNLVIRVPQALRVHNGTYACHVMGTEPDEFSSCEFIVSTAPAELITSSCNISSVKEMEPTSLTCTFSVNLNVTRKNFEVVRLDYEGEKVSCIISCIWKDDTLVCAPASGYLFASVVTDYFVIRIPRALRAHNGTYACQVMDTEPNEFSSCEFIVSAGR